jgi:hypothetical protein
MQVQQMAIAHCILARIAYGESRIYQEDVPVERQLSLSRQVGTERTRLERSFYTALHEWQRQPAEAPAIFCVATPDTR